MIDRDNIFTNSTTNTSKDIVVELGVLFSSLVQAIAKQPEHSDDLIYIYNQIKVSKHIEAIIGGQGILKAIEIEPEVLPIIAELYQNRFKTNLLRNET